MVLGVVFEGRLAYGGAGGGGGVSIYIHISIYCICLFCKHKIREVYQVMLGTIQKIAWPLVGSRTTRTNRGEGVWDARCVELELVSCL